MISHSELLALHENRFGTTGQLFSAPARVNLIGEHTDYTGGFVMPLAIDFETVAVVSPRDDGKAVMYSVNFKEEVSRELAGLAPTDRSHWSDYGMGVAWALQQRGVKLPGFNMSVNGDVPLGAGLSSSASVEVAVCMALLSLVKDSLAGPDIALLCQKAENDFAHSPCGIMDQFVIANAAAEKALLLDCRSLEFYLLPLGSDTKIVIANSMVKHSVAEGEYGDRRGEVEAGQAVLTKKNPQIKLLRDATIEDLREVKGGMSEASFKRCRHIITENARVIEARSALVGGDMKRFGDIMYAAHNSMRDDFQASCPEVDKLVEIAHTLPGCIGARITGGGFGGCTVNVVEADQAESFAEQLKQKYLDATGIKSDVFICKAVDGAVARSGAGK